MNAVRRSVGSWLILLSLLYAAMELNALGYGTTLLDKGAAAPDLATGQTALILFGSKGQPHPVYVTEHQRLVYYFWLGAGFAAFVADLGVLVGYGFSREMTGRHSRMRPRR